MKCLTDNVYYESRGEPLPGMILVARTALNRMQHPDFPRNACEVVYQPYQFSWTLVKQKLPNQEQWNKSAYAVYLALQHTSPALYFHAVSVQPEWAKKKQIVARVGNHIFYK